MTNKNSKIDLPFDRKNNQETGYFITGPENEANMAVIAKLGREL